MYWQTDRVLKINGKRLNIGVSIVDYRVKIGAEEFCTVTELSHNSLSCLLPPLAKGQSKKVDNHNETVPIKVSSKKFLVSSK